VSTGIEIVAIDDAPVEEHHVAPTASSAGFVRSRRVSPEDYPLWLVVSEVAAGGELTWDGDHGDEAVYVDRGAIHIDGGEACERGGAVLVEAGQPCRLVVDQPSRVLHFGPVDPTPPREGHLGPAAERGRRVHVVGPAGVWQAVDGVRLSCLLADSACETCRLTLLYTSRLGPYRAASHTHSEDELIHLLWGELRVGRHRILPGTTLAIRRDARYGFRSTDEGYAFLNYRPDLSLCTTDPGQPGLWETGPMMGMAPSPAPAHRTPTRQGDDEG
jgi:hypothetical protein